MSSMSSVVESWCRFYTSIPRSEELHLDYFALLYDFSAGRDLDVAIRQRHRRDISRRLEGRKRLTICHTDRIELMAPCCRYDPLRDRKRHGVDAIRRQSGH